MNSTLSELIRYLAAGIINTLVGYCVFLVMLNVIGLNPYYSNAISYAFGLIVAYIMNLLFVFKKSSHSLRSGYRFFIGFGISYGLNIMVFNASILYFKFQAEISQIMAMASYTICFYLINRYFVWAR